MDSLASTFLSLFVITSVRPERSEAKSKDAPAPGPVDRAGA